VLGWRAAMPIFIVDIAKGFVPGILSALDGTVPDVGTRVRRGRHHRPRLLGLRRVQGRQGRGDRCRRVPGAAPVAVLGGLVVWGSSSSCDGLRLARIHRGGRALPVFIAHGRTDGGRAGSLSLLLAILRDLLRIARTSAAGARRGASVPAEGAATATASEER
jgi:hypothetical protein